MPRRSGRVTRQPDRYKSYDMIPDELNAEPVNYNEALQDKDVELWKKAMKSKIESMYSNQVWNIVEPPKPIWCKWIYKKKRGADRKVETFKARFVAKGFTQKEGINYEKTFLPIAMLKKEGIEYGVQA